MGCKHGKGYTRCIMRSKYGNRAFNRDGTLKLSYLRKEKSIQMNRTGSRRNEYKIKALTEAINFRS